MGSEHAKTPVIFCPVGLVAKQFRAQPITDPKTMEVVGLELLHRSPLNFFDRDSMLAVDVCALENASILARHYRDRLRIHCNVELTSILNTHWWDAMAGVMWPSIVVEIVERNYLLGMGNAMHRTGIVVDGIRRRGGAIALDDVTGTEIELMAIGALRPEIIKIERMDFIAPIRQITNARLVAERIETEDDAHQAVCLGADELQGYWCDVMAEHEVHESLTPPGVTAKARQDQQDLQRMVA